jgi:hypothetical protein
MPFHPVKAKGCFSAQSHYEVLNYQDRVPLSLCIMEDTVGFLSIGGSHS